MPAKVTDRATDPRVVDRWEGGVGWIAHPDETMERASHALATAEGVWIVDPIDADGVDELIAEYGDVAGVVLLSNYHTRDADVFASRYQVPVTLPATLTGVAARLESDVERIDVGDSLGAYELIEVARSDVWQEYGLYDGETLVVGETLGAADYMRVGDERLGVMTLRRLNPPTAALADLDPVRVLGGHGPGVQEDATDALEDALDHARRRFPRALLENGREQLGSLIAALRT